MKKRLINLMPFLASFIGVVCAASLGSAQDTIPQELSPELAMYNSIEEGRRAWLKNAELFGNYTYTRTRFLSEEEALNEASSEGTVVLAARGLIAKKGGSYRLRVAYGDPPNTLDGDERALRFIEHSANEKYCLLVGPDPWRRDQIVGQLGRNSKGSIDPDIGGLVNLNTPFCLSVDSINETPWGLYLNESSSMETLDNGQVLLTSKGSEKEDYYNSANKYVVAYTKQAFVDTSGEYPRIEQVVLSAFLPDEPTPFWTKTVTVKEWKESGGIMVPSVVRSVDGPAAVWGEEKDFWFVSEWKSEDIGDRTPSDQDFAVKLDPEIPVRGMASVPPGNIYDINRITADDFPRRSFSPSNDDELWIVGIGLGLLIVLGVVVLRRRKKKRQANEGA